MYNLIQDTCWFNDHAVLNVRTDFMSLEVLADFSEIVSSALSRQACLIKRD